MTIDIKCFIDKSSLTLEEFESSAINRISSIDSANSNDVLTKLYSISPILDKIIVVVSDNDKSILGVSDNVLFSENISDYPLSKIPAKIIDYKELIITNSSTSTPSEINTAAQQLANNTDENKLNVVKIINYKNTEPSELIIDSSFVSMFDLGNIQLTQDSDAAIW